MTKRYWFVDCNHFDGMLNGAQTIVREVRNNNNGINDGLMIVGINQIDKNVNGGLSDDDAKLIAACPEMIDALERIIIHGLNAVTMIEAVNAIRKARGLETIKE